MTKEIEHLYAHPVFMPFEIKALATTVKEAEKYCATSPEQYLSGKHGYFKDGPTELQGAAMVLIFFGAFTIPLSVISSLITISWATITGGLLILTLTQWKNRDQRLLGHYKAEWQKQHELAINKLNIAAKNLVAIDEFFNKQVERFNKYQRYIETGVVSLDETQWLERKKLRDKLNAISDNLNKRVNQLDYLLDAETKPALDQEVIQMIDLLNQTEIGNEIAKLLDPRFRTLSETELETKALAVLEELPQII